MAILKLYLTKLTEKSPIETSVHRDLTTLQDIWQQAEQPNCVGLLHIDFVRPRIKNAEDLLLKHRGKVLVSAAVKWALPEEYQSSVEVIAELKLASKLIPLHQLLQGLGCDILEPQAVFQSALLTEAHAESPLTIAEAARQVLNDSDQPLNQDEIFARIAEQGLYHFGAKNPVSVLAVELNRYTRGTNYSKPAAEPLFGISKDARFYLLERKVTKLSDWVKQLSEDQPELAITASSYGVYDERGYSELAPSLPRSLRDQLDNYRFKSLLGSVNKQDPQAVIGILPHSMLGANTGSLCLPIRVSNVLGANGIASLAELRDVTLTEMLRWPRFGRKSARDFCAGIIESADKLADQLALGSDVTASAISELDDMTVVDESDERPDSVYLIELASRVPLKEHFEKMLENLQGNQRQVIESRTGYNGPILTLEAVGQQVGLTRERIRQIQKKCITKIIDTEYWDDCIAIKIDQLLIDRSTPLYIEMLELEDPWFQGFVGNYQHLGAIIELFSESDMRMVNLRGATVVSHIKSEDFDQCVSHFRKSLKDKALDGSWSRNDINIAFRAELSSKGAAELVPLLWREFSTSLQFTGDDDSSILISFGKSAEAAVATVLAQAEKPLHFNEIARRASIVLGKEVNERLAHNAAPRLGGKLFGRGIYGRSHFNPISERMSNNLRLIVTTMIYAGPLDKQWHCSEIYAQLESRFPAVPAEFDHYILNIILETADKLTYLNRMVWTRADSNQTVGDRVDMADAFTKILEDNGAPLKGKEIKDRLATIRGVSKNLQLQPTERMIQIGPDYWGLIERDIGGTKEDNLEKLNVLHEKLCECKKRIHVSEVKLLLDVSDCSDELPSAYALLNLAQRDSRFLLGHSMFIGLSEWGGSKWDY